jgi:glyoxylase-like metal-dependent hydrolase (beta-lactamase superfamily II)
VIHHLLAPNPGLMTGRGTNTYLVVGGGRHVAVVDPGPRDHPAHIDAILAAAEPLGTITHILVTHGHADHAPGAMLLGERARVRVAAHAGVPGAEIRLHEGDVVRVDEHRLEVLETPGHSEDSLSYWLAAERALFTGDVVAGSGTVVVDDRPGGLARYLDSVERLRALGTAALYPGHGPRVDDGPAKLQEYLDHRAQREAQVVGCLGAAGPLSVEQLVGRIYTDTPPGLLAMAARNVRAHLDKLEGEGRVALYGARWRLT